MSWIQENKFIAGLAGVTAVIGGAILYFGYSQGNAYEKKKAEYDALKDQHTRLEKSHPYPDETNLKKRRENIHQFAATIKEVKTMLERYQPGKLASPTPEQFSDAQVKMRDSLRNAFKKADTTLPEGCEFGFEKYAKVQASSSATAELNYQLGAIQWLLGKLAATKPDALLNVRRQELAIEKGAVAPPEPSRRTKRRGKKSNARRPKRGASPDVNPYTLMPVELAFTAKESAVREFFKEMANSKEYFYAIRSIRIRNEKQIPPAVKDAGFPEGGGAGNGGAAAGADEPFGGSAVPDDGGAAPEGEGEEGVPASKPAADGSRILKQVLGSEKLHVYISFDIVLLKGKKSQAATPTIKDES